MKLADQDSYGVDMDKTNHFFALHFIKTLMELKKSIEWNAEPEMLLFFTE
jgi:hypothetical protein